MRGMSGENGTYLEPDMKYGKKYLEAVKTVVENHKANKKYVDKK